MNNFQKILLNSFIVQEINRWRNEQLIDSNTCDQLIARYPVNSVKDQIIAILVTIGAVMVGLGSLLFIAAHWTEISVYGKLVLIFLSVIVANAAGWWFQFGKGVRPKLGAAFFLLGCFFYGSGIWLVSQIFNISGDLSTGLLLWGIGTTAMALATRSGMLATMSTVIIGSWALTYVGDSSTESQDLFRTLTALSGLGASIALAYWVHSPWSLASSLVSTSIWFLFFSHLHEFGLIILGCTFFSCFLWHRKNWQLMAGPYKYLSVVITYGSLLILTFDKSCRVDYSLIDSILCTILLTACLASAFITYVKDNDAGKELLCTVLTAFCSLCISTFSVELLRLLASNVLFVIVFSGLFTLAIKKLHSPWLINTSIFYIVIYIFCRYFDTFFSIMDRSLFFIVGGVMLMVIGAFVERKRRILLEGIKV